MRVAYMITLGAALFGGLSACSGGESSQPSAERAVVELPSELVDQVWAVKVATNDEVGQWSSDGWVALVMSRDPRAAVSAMGSVGGLPAARAHADASLLYRQASLMMANSFIETYERTPEPTDPLGAAHLLSVSHALLGERDDARTWSKKLEGSSDPTAAWHAPWATWLAGEAQWPPDLGALPTALPEPKVGEWPEVPEAPHYQLPEREGSTAMRPMGDPGALVALALWHDAAAHLAAGDQGAQLDAYNARYQLPVETLATGAPPLDMAMLFGSDFLVPGDGAFMEDVLGPAGVDAVSKHVSTSLLAKLVEISLVEGKFNAEAAEDATVNLRDAVLAASKARAGGEAQAHHRTLADVVYVGTMRSLSLVAERLGQREEGGKLRLAALDHATSATACPAGMMAMAAWDTGNRYPSRALDIIHRLERKVSALEGARLGLDVMALRVSRERAGELPGM